jgi:hypothetical protein
MLFRQEVVLPFLEVKDYFLVPQTPQAAPPTLSQGIMISYCD